ncbi:hypothetical protein bcere0009_56500 [Bacillus cereus R309803]|nr:hypothetical protein bcere0009_56500 [Bacillus cereus R309803]
MGSIIKEYFQLFSIVSILSLVGDNSTGSSLTIIRIDKKMIHSFS